MTIFETGTYTECGTGSTGLSPVVGIEITFTAVTASQAVTLNIQVNNIGTADDMLLGVNDLSVGNKSYNVLFREGSCFAISSGCGSTLDFDFQTSASAVTAATASLGSLSSYFTNHPTPSSVFGLNHLDFGDILIHYALTVYTDRSGTYFITTHSGFTLVNNKTQPYADMVFNRNGINALTDPSTHDFFIYADFTEVTTVPLPVALPLYGTGIAVLGFTGWCRSRKA